MKMKYNVWKENEFNEKSNYALPFLQNGTLCNKVSDCFGFYAKAPKF